MGAAGAGNSLPRRANYAATLVAARSDSRTTGLKCPRSPARVARRPRRSPRHRDCAGAPGAAAAVQHVDALDEDRENHGDVDVALRDVRAEASATSAMPIMIRKPSASTFTVGCASTKEATGPGGHQHHHRKHHRDGHHPDLVGHADRRHDAVDRENQVDERDLGDDGAEAAPHPGARLALFALQLAWISWVAL